MRDRKRRTDYSFKSIKVEADNNNQPHPNLGSLLRSEIDRIDSSAAEKDYRKTADLIKTFFRAYPPQSIFIVDDAQWADEASLNLLSELIGKITIVLVFRSDQVLLENWLPGLFLEQQNREPLISFNLAAFVVLRYQNVNNTNQRFQNTRLSIFCV